MVTPIRDVLGTAARWWGLGRLAGLVDLQRRWPAIVGTALAEVSRPGRLRGDTLVVVAVHPVAAQEVRWRERAILRAAAAGCGEGPSRVRVVVRTRLPGVLRQPASSGVRGGRGRPATGTARGRRG